MLHKLYTEHSLYNQGTAAASGGGTADDIKQNRISLWGESIGFIAAYNTDATNPILANWQLMQEAANTVNMTFTGIAGGTGIIALDAGQPAGLYDIWIGGNVQGVSLESGIIDYHLTKFIGGGGVGVKYGSRWIWIENITNQGSTGFGYTVTVPLTGGDTIRIDLENQGIVRQLKHDDINIIIKQVKGVS